MPGGGAVVSGSGMQAGKKNVVVGILMAAFAAFGGILFGYDTGTISGLIAMENWLQTFGDPDELAEFGYSLSTADKSLVVSILSAGTFFGALLAYPFGDILGRRWGLIASCAVFSLGVGLQLDDHWATFIVGRVVAGLGVGLVSCLVPMYQAETSPAWIRGGVVAAYQWAITIGLLLAAIVNQSTKDRQSQAAWHIPIAVQFVWAAILAGGMLILPESPRYLVKRGNTEAAKKSLARLLSLPVESKEVEVEYEDIAAGIAREQETSGGTSYVDCFRNGQNRTRFRVLTGIFLQAWQQLTGINFIFYYGTTYFQSAGITNAFVITIITNVVNVVMTIPGILLIDRAGRRNMLLIGAAGMFICELIVAITGVSVGSDNKAAQNVLIAFVCIYIAFFAATWGPLAWVVTSEIFPTNIRAKAMSLSTASNWLWNWGIGYATPYLVDNKPGDANLGSKVFFIWSATCLGCLIFTWFCIPETKGLSLEQVDLIYLNSSIQGSNAYRRELLAQNVHPSDPEAIQRTISRGDHSSHDEKDKNEFEHA